MPHIDVNGTRIHYTDTGGSGPVIVFSHGLLFDTRMFDAQIAALKDKYRCIAFDHRGQGQSAIPDSGYDMDTLSLDAAELIRDLGVAKCHFVGLSMGGFVAQRLAVNHSELLCSVTILDSAADPEPKKNLKGYRFLNLLMRWLGAWSIVGSVMPILFGQSFLADESRKKIRDTWRERLKQLSRKGTPLAVKGVLERGSFSDQLPKITLPTLIIVGTEDVATVPAKSDAMHAAIKGSELIYIPNAGHSAPIENPQAVTQVIETFISSVEAG
jgi:3-oxoadipate enol-lactonase